MGRRGDRPTHDAGRCSVRVLGFRPWVYHGLNEAQRRHRELRRLVQNGGVAPALAGAAPLLFLAMRVLSLIAVIVVSVVLSPIAASAQDLPPALASRFAEGVAALKAGSPNEAEQVFRDVLRKGGDRSFVHHNLGIALQQRGRHAEAVAEFRAASRLDPSFGPARLLAGVSLLKLDRPAEAVVALERAVKLMPTEPLAHLQLADAYERTGRIEGLVDEYRRLVEMSPDDDEYAYRLGKAYLQLAQVSYARLRTVNPKSARASQALATEYANQGRRDLAQQEFERAAKLDPTLVEIHLALAQLYAAEQRWDDAAREVDRELALVPESRDAMELKAKIVERRAP
jgi:tetratricopeptide (TPR) repeat protein